MSVFFNGRLLVSPSVESAVYDAGLASVSPERTTNILALIGTSEGGTPKKAEYFDSPVIARRRLRRGDLLDAVERAFNPSAEVGAPYRICTVRVENGEQSSILLQDDAGNDVINLRSADYGAHTNGIRVVIEAGSQFGKRVTVQQDEAYYTKDNLARSMFSVRYSGSEATATVEVTATQVILAAGAGAPIALTFASYRNVRELCDAINSQVGWSTIAGYPTSPVANVLDGMAPTSAKSVDLDVRADLQVIVEWFNTAARDLVFAERVTGALAPPANIPGSYLSGGSNGEAPTNEDWQDAFDSLQGEDVQWIVPLSANPSIWYMADAHVQFMSSIGKSERRCFVGGDVVMGTLENAIDEVRDHALTLNSDRTALCFPPILEYNDAGELEPRPAFFLAAQIAGGFASVNPGNTMTNKVLRVAGLDPSVVNLYDSDKLISSGVCAARQTRRGYIVSKAVSTWLSNDNYNRVEISTGAALDFVARTVREALEIFIGRKASPITLYEAITRTESVLRNLARPEPVGVGVIVGDEANPAYRNITAEIEGDILRVYFECSPVIPINFVLVGIYARAYSGSVSAAVTQ